jgi:KaiC/GvpD/RAD55 family RecA-like ATPase
MEKNPGSTRGPHLPDIVGFEELFPIDEPEQSGHENGNSQENKKDLRGLPDGSCILISGLPGAGKTILALSLVRSLMKKQGYEHFKLYYISTEIARKKLEKDFKTFGWFRQARTNGEADPGDPIFSVNRVIIPEMPDLGPFHEARGASSLVDLVLKQTRLPVETNKSDNSPVFVIIDSLTAILKDSKNTGERRAQAARCITNLSETMFPGRLGLLFVLSEHSSDSKAELEVQPEEYLADIVFRLGTKDTGRGYRLRTLEITKSRAVNMLIGEHSYAIVTRDRLDDVIAQEATKDKVHKMAVEKQGGQDNQGNWGTVIVAPRKRLPSIGKENLVDKNKGAENEPHISKMLCSGTPGLDAMLLGKFPGTQRKVNQITSSKMGGLQQGSTTLILGGTGAGKTTLALQFLLEHGLENRDNADLNDKMKQTLYINFENKPDKVISKYPGSDEAKKALRNCRYLYRHGLNLDVNLLLLEIANVIKLGIKRVVVDGLSDLIQATAGNQDYAHLIEALLYTIGSYAGNGNTTAMLTYEMPSNLGTFSPPSQELSIAVDNIVVLRHQQISNELQKTIFVLKARGQRSDRQVREVAIFNNIHKPLEVRSGRLELYSNLLVGEPQFIKASLHFFAENPAESKFNDRLVEILCKRYGSELELKVVGFSRPEITETLIEMLSPERRITSSNLNIISLDEWWIREYEEERTRRHEILDYLLELDEFCITSQDVTEHQSDGNIRQDSCRDYRSNFLAFEVEKASRVKIEKTDKLNPTPPVETSNSHTPILETLAVPNYQDFGLFCVNRNILYKLFPEEKVNAQMNGEKDEWKWSLKYLPRVWTKLDKKKNIFSEELKKDEKSSTILELISLAKKRHDEKKNPDCDKPFIGFAFDMETPHTLICVFLELCWAFGADEDFLVKDAIEYLSKEGTKDGKKEPLSSNPQRRNRLKRHPAILAIRLLQYLVKHKLMPVRTTLEDCKNALFSRQWYSTFCEITTGELEKQAKDREQQKQQDCSHDGDFRTSVFPIVFFPLGSKTMQSSNKNSSALRYKTLRRAMSDVYKRFDRIAKRVLVTLQCRNPDADGKVIKPFEKIIEDAKCAWQDYNSGHQKDRNNIDKSLHKPLIAILGKLADQLHDLVRRQPEFQPYHPMTENLPKTGIDDKTLWEYLPASRSLDIRDVAELIEGHRFRLDLIRAEIEGKTLADVLDGQTTGRDIKLDNPADKDTFRALTGYAASGSWLIGVTKPVQSPGVAWNMIEEVTSLSNACERSNLGAGIPSRKDFFEFHGSESVKYASHLTWRGLLKYAGSRARRRDRTICPACSMSRLTAIVDRQIRFCLSAAEWNKDDDALCNISIDAYIEILKDLTEQISRQWKDLEEPDGYCYICPRSQVCREAIQKNKSLG